MTETINCLLSRNPLAWMFKTLLAGLGATCKLFAPFTSAFTFCENRLSLTNDAGGLTPYAIGASVAVLPSLSVAFAVIELRCAVELSLNNTLMWTVEEKVDFPL